MDPQLFGTIAVMRGISPSGIHDVDRTEWMPLPLGNPSECNAVVVAALLLVISDPAFPVPGWNGGVQNCNEPSTISTFAECVLR
jgi:hypothetical protein